MKTYLNDNKQFILIAFIWLVSGIYFGPLVYVVIPALIILMYSKGMHLEILLGFFLMLTLSDSRLHSLSFAGDIKNIYIIILTLILFQERISLKVAIYKYFIPFFIIAIYCIFDSPNMALSFQKVLSYILLFVVLPWTLKVLKNIFSRKFFFIIHSQIFVIILRRGIILQLPLFQKKIVICVKEKKLNRKKLRHLVNVQPRICALFAWFV